MVNVSNPDILPLNYLYGFFDSDAMAMTDLIVAAMFIVLGIFFLGKINIKRIYSMSISFFILFL